MPVHNAEIARPARLDIDDHYCRLAKDMGVKVALHELAKLLARR